MGLDLDMRLTRAEQHELAKLEVERERRRELKQRIFLNENIDGEFKFSETVA